MSRLMVAVRLFREDDLDKDWQSVPIHGYFPVFVGSEEQQRYIEGRIRTIYFEKDESLVKVRWSFWDKDDDGQWCEA